MLIKLWDWDKGWKNVQIFEGHSHYVMVSGLDFFWRWLSWKRQDAFQETFPEIRVSGLQKCQWKMMG